MIDLRKRTLPNAIEVDGVVYSLNTDFRVWIEYERCLREEGIANYCIFAGEVPPGTEWEAQAKAFLVNPNSTPRGGSMSNDRAVDFVEDGAFIVASFWQAYGIDLTSIDYMHWHVFQALFDGLPDDTKMAKIMAYRTYQKPKGSYEESMRKLKQEWRLPTEGYLEAQRIAEQMYEKEMNHDN